jgi:acetyl-CoA acyltransferase 1
MESVKRL